MTTPGLYTSDTDDWHTPEHIITRTVEVLGGIDLDPCAEQARKVPAQQHFTVEEDGLAQQWVGTVYMNPPYGRGIAKWIAKLKWEYDFGETTAAVALLPARTDTQWMQALSRAPRCFLWGRLRFSNSKNSAPFPSVVVYLGREIAEQYRFAGAFGDIGDCYAPC